MLTILGERQRFCDGVSRRNFLKIGAMTLGGLTLTDLLAAEAPCAYAVKESTGRVEAVDIDEEIGCRIGRDPVAARYGVDGDAAGHALRRLDPRRQRLADGGFIPHDADADAAQRGKLIGWRRNLIRGLGENSGLAAQLAIYQARYGDWRELFYNIDRLQKVTKEDIRRVANKTFIPTNRTVAIVQTVPASQVPGENAPGGAQ